MTFNIARPLIFVILKSLPAGNDIKICHALFRSYKFYTWHNLLRVFSLQLALPTMKQILLLIAVYSLIINQSSKSHKAKKQTFTPVHEKTESPRKSAQGSVQARDMVAPIFSFTTFRLISSYPLYTSGK